MTEFSRALIDAVHMLETRAGDLKNWRNVGDGEGIRLDDCNHFRERNCGREAGIRTVWMRYPNGRRRGFLTDIGHRDTGNRRLGPLVRSPNCQPRIELLSTIQVAII